MRYTACHLPFSLEAWLKEPPSTPSSALPSREPWVLWMRTFVVDFFSVPTNRRERLSAVRGLQFEVQRRRMAAAHTHPACAARRADASVHLSKIAVALRKRRFDISIAPRESRGLAAGSRQYRTPKDLTCESSFGGYCRDDLITMVDTDYYLDVKQLSKYAGCDIAFYHLRPNGLGGKSEESLWAFTDPDTVVEEVDGGGVYTHKVWDWTGDVVVLQSWCRTHVYDVVSYDAGASRAVTVLLLARTINLPLWLAEWFVPGLGGLRPHRIEVVSMGDYLVGTFGRAVDRRVDIMQRGLLGCTPVSVRPDTYNALAIAATIPNTDKKVVGVELLPSAAERIVRLQSERVDTAGCYVLSRFFSGSYRPHQFCNYQSKGERTLEDGIASAVVAAVPLAGSGCAPTASANNEARAVLARVTAVANRTEFSDELKSYGEEFSEQVVRDPYKGVPWDMAELRMQQDRPTQRARRLEEEQHTYSKTPSLSTVSFQKRETYAKPGDPRLINQVPTEHTNRLCVFAGAIKQHLKSANGRWYYVGKTPEQVALGLRGLQRGVDGPLTGGDYSRMDGRTSVDYRRYVLQPIYLRYFAEKYHPELRELLGREEKAKTRTRRFGVRAVLGGANVSGSGITTDLNTVDAAFNEYVARRRAGESPRAAFMKLGAYFGDDSVVDARVFPGVLAVANETGMKLEAEARPEDAGPGYVVFLSRVYPDIRTSLGSHPDVVRSLRKLCTVVVGKQASGKDALLKLRLKVEGLLISDPHVPVVSAYAQALLKVYDLRRVTGTAAQWAAAIEADADYRRKKAVGSYPTRPADWDLLLPSVANGMGIHPAEAAVVDRRLREATTEADLVALAQESALVPLPEWAEWVPTEVAAL